MPKFWSAQAALLYAAAAAHLALPLPSRSLCAVRPNTVCAAHWQRPLARSLYLHISQPFDKRLSSTPKILIDIFVDDLLDELYGMGWRRYHRGPGPAGQPLLCG